MNQPANCSRDKAQQNRLAYSSDAAVQAYGTAYGLSPSEELLTGKYFPAGGRILDLGCGGGRTTLPLHEKGYQVIGIDLSEPLIHAARKRNPAVDFRVGSFCQLDFPDASIDGVFISFNGLDCAHPESERVKALREAARVLRPGGALVFSSHNIKALHGSPYFFHRRSARRMRWALRHMPCAFQDHAYILDLDGAWIFFGSQNYVIAQAASLGLVWAETVGFRLSRNRLFNNYCSIWIDYAFRKP